ncbi:MAG: DUF5694 domain-containing protein [Gemmatimonadota bacterium]
MKTAYLFLGLFAMPATAWSQSPARAEILVLGTYHMASPGHDIHNMVADDVLSPKRQAEMEQLVDVLKRFHPTKIAIEADVGSQRVGQQYADYLAGKYTLSRNEIDQIGYRLAKELGHGTVYPVDADGDFPFQRVVNYAKANGRAEAFEAIQAGVGRRVKEEGDFLRSHTLLETVESMNADSSVAQAVAEYFAYVPYADRFEYAGPDLLAMWYQRNIHIYHNIRALVESPNDRILVIYGAGHLGWLQQDIANDGTVALRKLSDLTKRK